MLDPFEQKKRQILQDISGDKDSSKDLSPKGTIDEKCIPIIDLINSNKDMVTTSSCSGRVSVFIEGIKDHTKIGSKGNEGRWLYVNHSPDVHNWNANFEYEQDLDTFPDSPLTRFILYKFEPLILHVKCRDLASAQALYKTAMNCGFRESGINNNNVVAIRISIKLDVPIGYLREETPVLTVNENYLKFITKLSVDRFIENFKKLDQLYQAIEILNNTVEVAEEQKETKDQRRQRKIEEGMARRDGVRLAKEQKKLEKLALQNQKS
ncbi:tRNA(Phe) wybutosine-synthesizing methylase [Yamadazyma tenuis]|uniref:tRNA wybutosine-synthesizing protein 3 n=1 Tax=Candida tenuis (strain ATCC 10573 / BCRC 21748 / CBS 615 / JCM 9827 / NBRC 10315 / NRRL Y-1498 / VKM Y-70) TaxID=590646 RepID=G3B1Y6_CANTC|nr:uncharacterized protein CANTEDRAFT_113328 [Yamadazyma tenuis ATCC 10573]XP_006685830.1 uncharacterized protein CANTEDRAFT_113328 [Yamadazyma tenuis ATCC 10573]EGV65023.1 hypothetical protein CANTEDRAFT_113328 [Yamadazyma tenuis ATCC 10573]EGV65024.1 hypothetical protein CANTEDRAFT_113328 [Yamadazyma tenuis ATCC 10573]WEJ97328.1 tRNA(Phe) wybutosine-synthesizing methylase [Yamadazyma tenuis]